MSIIFFGDWKGGRGVLRGPNAPIIFQGGRMEGWKRGRGTCVVKIADYRGLHGGLGGVFCAFQFSLTKWGDVSKKTSFSAFSVSAALNPQFAAYSPKCDGHPDITREIPSSTLPPFHPFLYHSPKTLHTFQQKCALTTLTPRGQFQSRNRASFRFNFTTKAWKLRAGRFNLVIEASFRFNFTKKLTKHDIALCFNLVIEHLFVSTFDESHL